MSNNTGDAIDKTINKICERIQDNLEEGKPVRESTIGMMNALTGIISARATDKAISEAKNEGEERLVLSLELLRCMDEVKKEKLNQGELTGDELLRRITNGERI
ncbi:hypothetical protein [[Clostridium] symbiosum]|uniref:hypothetical protein n=1 Tax=Clostridium symbiosum TaxID=1512 RepID=UPI00319E34C2